MAVESDVLAACVYCGASDRIRSSYLEAARALGRALAEARIDIIYGGGASGMMGALADAALASGGNVHGVRPKPGPMLEQEHTSLTSMTYTDDLGSRKRLMWERSGAIVVLPGGTGTADELLEAITQKRLGVHRLPIVVVNLDRYFDDLLRFIRHAVAEGFADERQLSLWNTVSDVRAALSYLPKREP